MVTQRGFEIIKIDLNRRTHHHQGHAGQQTRGAISLRVQSTFAKSAFTEIDRLIYLAACDYGLRLVNQGHVAEV